jgi:dipeptidyl aminopeptidase/acylaminoacyl peptidase
MNKTIFSIALIFLIVILIIVSVFVGEPKLKKQNTQGDVKINNPLSINVMRAEKYPGSDLKIEETRPDGASYHEYIASYKSEGNIIYGLLTVPSGKKPVHGWPVIILLHGYIAPNVYRTTERYVQYVANIANSGYIVFKPDYRGHDNSQGKPESAYYSPAYTTDVLNAIATLKKNKDADPNKIGLWGHSMGGTLAERAMVVDPKDIKAVVIWGGVIGSYEDWLQQKGISYTKGKEVQVLIKKYGAPVATSSFWQAVDPALNLKDVTAPVQLHHGTADESVPPQLSQDFYNELKKAGKTVEIYSYEGGDHNISSPNYEIAMERSIKFFDKYVKK